VCGAGREMIDATSLRDRELMGVSRKKRVPYSQIP
jgi:hypothetical protein